MNFKKDFPLLTNNDLTYLDSAATSQKPAYVIDGVKKFLESWYANIHRGDYALSQQSEDLYHASKEAYANLINASADEIIYTYNATYAFNILVQALVLSGKLPQGSKILLWIAEHHANIVPRQIASKFGWIEIEWINIDENYDIDMNDFKKKYTDNVKVVSLSAASNVTGKIYDLSAISSLLRDDTLFIVDASQALPHFAINVASLACDALIATGHKMMAETGIGMLYMTKALCKELTPAIGWGGSIEDVSTTGHSLRQSVEKFEPGTPNIIGAVSLLKAIEYMHSIGGYETMMKYEHELISHTLSHFERLGDKVTLIGPRTAEDRIGVFSFLVPTFPNHIQLGEKLAAAWFCVRTGAHCTHPFFQQIEEKGSCRMSLSIYNTKEEIGRFFSVLEEIIS